MTPPKQWANSLSHPSGLTPGHIPAAAAKPYPHPKKGTNLPPLQEQESKGTCLCLLPLLRQEPQ